MTPQPRVLHLTTSAVSLDWLLAPQLHAFSDAGFEVVTASGGGAHAENLERSGLTHHTVHSFSRNVDAAADVRSIGELRRLLRHVRPDILHTHNPKPGVLGRLVGRAMGVPVVINTVHGLYAQLEDPVVRRGAVYGAERLAATCSDAELVQNVEDVATLRSLGVPAKRIHLLGNGIDLSRFQSTREHSINATKLRAELGIDSSTPVVGMIGRLVWEKGYRELFEAVASLRASRGATFEVVVVGPDESAKEGAVDSETKLQMQAAGIRFLGSRTDIPDVLSAFDVFALPSYREGFPRAAMEASAMGVPVIATDVRGCRQVVQHEQTGLLVPVRDSGALAEAIGRLLADVPLRAQLGHRACERAMAEFDQDRVIARTLAVYRSHLAARMLPLPQSRSARYIDSIDLVADAASNRDAESLAA